jgi:hypothetical protein
MPQQMPVSALQAQYECIIRTLAPMKKRLEGLPR